MSAPLTDLQFARRLIDEAGRRLDALEQRDRIESEQMPFTFPCGGCGVEAEDDLCPTCTAEHAPDYLAWLESFAEGERERTGSRNYPTRDWREAS